MHQYCNYRRRVVCVCCVLFASLQSPSLSDDFYLLSGDRSAYEARVGLIDHAQCQIEMAYYAIDSGDIALTLISRLRDAAKRGVKVRILVDGLKSRLPSDFENLLIEEGIELRAYHPPMKRHPLWLNRRIHYKMMVVDQRAMIVGSRNLEDSHFGLDDENFVDTDALLTGEVCSRAAEHFETLWNSEEVYPVDESFSFGLNARDNIEMKVPRMVAASLLQTAFSVNKEKLPSEIASGQKSGALNTAHASLVEKRVEVYELRSNEAEKRLGCRNDFLDHPNTVCLDHYVENIGCSVLIHDRGTDKSAREFQTQVIAIIDTSQECLWIQTPYPVLARRVKAALQRAIDRGVKITLLTNSLEAIDRTAPYAAYQNDKRNYRRMGIDIVEYTGEGTLHAKAILVDNASVLIGSYNMDARSDRLNLEFGVWIHDERVCNLIQQQMLRRMRTSEPAFQDDSRLPKVVRGDASFRKYSQMRFRQLLAPLIRSSL